MVVSRAPGMASAISRADTTSQMKSGEAQQADPIQAQVKPHRVDVRCVVGQRVRGGIRRRGGAAGAARVEPDDGGNLVQSRQVTEECGAPCRDRPSER